MNYRIRIRGNVNKYLNKIPHRDKMAILFQIHEKLAVSPYSNGRNPKKLKGIPAFRLRVGDYRVLYEIEGSDINIYKLSHRKDIYR